MKFKILSIDFNLIGKTVTNASFYNAPAFSDYDALVIDPINISKRWGNIRPRSDGSLWCYSDTDGGLSKGLEEFMKRRREESELLLEKTGGLIICFLRQKGMILNYKDNVYDKYSNDIHCYSWLPSREFNYTYEERSPYTNKLETVEGTLSFPDYNFELIPRTGKEIGEIDKTHPFSHYFMELKNEIGFEAVIDGNILKVTKPLAKNKVGEVVALELSFEKGKFLFLPRVGELVVIRKISNILMDCIRKSLHWSQPLTSPEWVNNYELPDETAVKKELENHQTKIINLEKEKQKIEDRENKLKMLKSMLYEQGKYGLEPPVRETFRILGFNVLDPEEYNEDYDLYAKERDLEIIGEIEGSNNKVDVWKYRQLLDFVNNEMEKGKNVKGILIGNAFIGVDPEKRPEQFTEKAILGCERQKFCRMTTSELFKAVRAVLSDPHNERLKKNIKQKILQCKKEFKFE